MKDNPPERAHITSRTAESSIDLTERFRATGLRHKVVGSARFVACHRLAKADGERHEHYALLWSVRCAVTGCLPVRRSRMSRGELLFIEYPGFPEGTGDDRNIRLVALLSDPVTVELFLPEEIEEI